MKLVVYEHITSGAFAARALPASLAHEGDWMLNAIVQDLADLAQFELAVMRDVRLPELTTAAQPEYLWVESSQNFSRVWQRCLQQHELFLIIAPESDNQLLALQQSITAAGKIYLGCDTQASQITSDKMLCYQLLSDRGIKTPLTLDTNSWMRLSHSDSQAWVIKPYDGAGCLDTYLFQSSEAAFSYLSQLSESVRNNLIVQPYIKGIPASLSLFVSNQHITLLSINRQHIDNDEGTLKYKHSEVLADPLPISYQDAEQIALTIKQALPGLWGFVGIDLIIEPGGTVSIIEINPRLTTSYVNLRKALRENPAQQLQRFIHERSPTALTL